jgi:hypothetical protein
MTETGVKRYTSLGSITYGMACIIEIAKTDTRIKIKKLEESITSIERKTLN